MTPKQVYEATHSLKRRKSPEEIVAEFENAVEVTQVIGLLLSNLTDYNKRIEDLEIENQELKLKMRKRKRKGEVA